ncbi:MAG: hypothetical protein HFF24_07875 [Oscillospiraceae bacterium]|nr:hypothetical protein [Oscillospiraceae bacterium]
MGMKRFVALFLACAIAMGALSLTATAETGHYEDNALQMEDMKREMIDVSKVEVLIAPDGYFYFLNVEGGSINQSIRVSQSGSYAVAVRNNSSYTVSVVGFVTY